MYSVIIGVCIFAICSGVSVADTNYPSELQKCRMDDNECITEVAQLFATNQSHGIPVIDLPSLDPLFVGKLDMVREKKFSILKILTMEHIDWKNSNLIFYGLKNATVSITGFTKNLNDSNVMVSIFFPNLTATSDYKLNFKFLQRVTFGEGKLRFEFENFEFRWNFKLRLYEKDDGKQYMSIDQPKIDWTIKTVSDLNFGTLFNGNALLSRLEHEFLNKNGKHLTDTVKSDAAPEYARAFTDIVEPIFSKFSIDEMFLIDE